MLIIKVKIKVTSSGRDIVIGEGPRDGFCDVVHILFLLLGDCFKDVHFTSIC